jgi:L-threonylcarbamoyladenylate synthase
MAVDTAVDALRDGLTVILPTDTVYGLTASCYREPPVERLRRLKGTPPAQPIALVASDFEVVLDAVPELRGRAAVLARALLPSRLTLILPNPAKRFRWLTGPDPTKIGIRVPDLPPASRTILDRVGAVAATSANVHGGRDPARPEDIPEQIWKGAAALIDVGELPGTPSTVVDLTEGQPRVLREGAVSADEALATIARVANE